MRKGPIVCLEANRDLHFRPQALRRWYIFLPLGLDLPSIELSLSFETPFFDVEVEVQQIPGDPIRDVDITVKTKPPPPPPPDDEEFCFFGVIFC